MAAIRPIRITKNDREEYRRLARNAKNKISRTRNKFGIDLSSEIAIPKLDSFATRNEFNEWKAQVKSFTNRNNTRFQFVENKYGVVASKAEINKIDRDTKRAQRIAKKLAKEAADKPFVAGGKKQGTVGQRMLQMGKPNTADIVIPPDFDFNKIDSRRRLESKARAMHERADPNFLEKRMGLMKNNFILALEKTYNSDAHELAEMIRAMEARDFYEMYLSYEEFKIPEVYTEYHKGTEVEPYVEQMMANIEMYNKGDNKDLRGF